MKKSNDLISDAWRKISSENTLYSAQWLCDETWYRVIERYYPLLPDMINFNRNPGTYCHREAVKCIVVSSC
jgi:hypothetical protein